MKEFQIKKETIRDYLLGRISDEKLHGEIEEKLFSDDEFCDQVELIEDDLINEYSFGKLIAKDLADFEKSLENNPERRSKVEFAGLLKEKVQIETSEVTREITEKSSFVDSIKAFLSQPIYAGAFGLLLIAALFSAFYILLPNDTDELAQIKNIYQNERPVNSRISDFEYSPYVATRSETTDESRRNKLRIVENNLLEAVEMNSNASTHHALGVFYVTQKNFDEAIKNLQQAVKLAENNARYRNDLGTAYFEFAKNGDKTKRLQNLALANEEFTKAYVIDPNLNEALFNRSLVLEALNLPKQAEQSWNKYLQKDRNSKWTEEAKKNLERIKQKEINFKTKEQVLDEFLTAYRQNDDIRVLKIHNETKGIFNGTALHQQLTSKYLESSKQTNPKISDEYLKALKHIGELEKENHADFFFAELADYYSNLNNSQIDTLIIAKRHLSEGIKFVNKGKYSDSISKFEESKTAFLNAGNEIESNIAELWIGEMLPDIGEISESQKRLNLLVLNLESKKYKVILPIAFYWLGIGKFRQKEFSQNIDYKKKAIKIALETDNLYELKHANESMAGTLNYLGEFDRSLDYLSVATDENDIYYSNKSQTWRNLLTSALFLDKLNFESTAIDFAFESVNFSKTHLPKTSAVDGSIRELIKSLSNSERFDEALIFAEEANKIALGKKETKDNYSLIADSFLERANVRSKMQNCENALTDYEKALAYYAKIPETKFNLFDVHKGRLLCFKSLDRDLDFQTELKKVLELSEEYRQNIRQDSTRQAFFESEQIIFDVAIEDALSQANKEKAFELIEISKSRSLLDFVKSEKSIEQIKQDFSAVSQPYSITDIQIKMPANVQIIQYALLNNKLAILVIENDKFDLIEKDITIKEIENKILDYRNNILANKDAAELNATSQELYNLLIPNSLDKLKTICFVLDKSLHQVPFASLLSKDRKYLIEDFAIFYSPSSSVFVVATEIAKTKEKKSNEKLLSIGNPQFERTENPNLADLPNAQIEAETISNNYSNAKTFVGQNATKKNFITNFENVEVIHFAGHFIANGQSTGNSKLVFSDGNLRSFELTKTRLKKSKLVVLSACETAFEKINKSEGAIGIGRTFLAIGTPLIIASNWKVDSEATKDLMIAFHNKRKMQKLTSIESLRQTQIELLQNEQTKSPYFWSAFSAIGGYVNY